MSRLGRSQPVQPQAWHGFVDPGPGPVGTTPPRPTVVPLADERARQRPAQPPVEISGVATDNPPAAEVVPLLEQRRTQTPPPVVLSGVLAPQAAPTVNPPAPVVVPLTERVRNAGGGGEIGAGYPDGVTPPPPVNVDRQDQRARLDTPEPVVLSGVLAPQVVVTATPPAPLVVTPEGRRRDTAAPVATHGLDEVAPPEPTVVEPGRRRQQPGETFTFDQTKVVAPAPAVTAPPAPVNVDRPERKPRTPDPVAISGALLGTGAAQPAATPPAPYVVPIEERRRFLALIPPEVKRGYDVAPPTVAPPPPTVVPPEDRSRRPQGGGEISSGYPTPDVTPPAPFVVPLEERKRLLHRFLEPPTVRRGFLGNTPANGVLPNRPTLLDREDQRKRYLPQPALIASGVLAPPAPVVPVTVNPGTDWAAEMSTW